MNINQILNKVRADIINKTYDMVPTIKNRSSKRKYGLTTYDIESYISSLTCNDLHQGPVQDRDLPNEVLYIFKKEIMPNIIFYTKLKIKNNQVKILSCHEDEN